ncbi:radical SAM family heme chaperone HemW [Candidatus Dependentiae bacterium]|nr:radical SAM family heme chaperone HemW [Candidatus Dependentiae bacterium]
MLNKFEHIYIHWPFCRSKCYYCDFLSFCNKEDYQQKYHNVLIEQIKKFKNTKKIKTIFLGGGTPSIYPLDLLEELFFQLKSSFDLSETREITIEANPKDITKEKLEKWKELGINRLSIGVQILDDKVLKSLGRNQKVEDVINAIDIAPRYFDNISVDLILGLPNVSNINWLKTINTIVSWPIKHISVYLLTLYKGTKLDQKIKNKEIFLQNDDTISSLYLDTVTILKKNDFLQYETSNFAKKGFESIHNIAYWDRRPYLGLGLGASSFNGLNRFVNEKNLNIFLEKGQSALLEDTYREIVSKKEAFLETLMLGLRQRKGVGLQRMLYFLRDEDKTIFLNNISDLEEQGLIRLAGGRIFLTLKGILLENEVVLKLV